MRALDIDFAPRRRTSLWFMGCVVLALSLVVASHQGLRCWQHFKANSALTAENVRLQRLIEEAEPFASETETPASKEATAGAARALDRLNAPWDALFEDVESVMNGDVALLSLEPDLTLREIRFAAGDQERALALLRPIANESLVFAPARQLQREIAAEVSKRHFQEPVLRMAGATPINLDFRDANVKMVFDALSRSTGINFILDKDLSPELKTTVFLRNAHLTEAIDLILRTSQLRSKLLGESTVLIYPDTPEKLKDHQELIVRAFYLQDASAAQMQTTLKTLLKSKDLVVDEKLNLIVMRDTPQAIRLAEKLVALHDLAEPEVMLEMEVVEVQQDALLNLGIQWPAQLTLTPLANGNGNLTLAELRNLNSSRLGASLSSPIIHLRQESGVTNLLANPRIRVKNREKALVMIGDKVPVITTTSTSSGFVAESVQYLDVGLKLNVEPSVYPSDDVEIKVTLEVSSIAKQISTATGTVAYQIGTRNASTVLRLRDGQTQILAGLINDQDRKSFSGVPGLSQLPLIGRLFTAPLDSSTKNEIVLSITPRLVRPVSRPDAQALEFWSGTESVLSNAPLRFTGGVPKDEKEAITPSSAEAPALKATP
jgi:general secretion pathway protein D